MKRVLVLTLLVVAAGACKSKATASPDASAATAAVKLSDLSGSLDSVRAEFNAHRREARFLTLLSPA
jgi:hypothetical protein